jgi:hypothetical protein
MFFVGATFSCREFQVHSEVMDVQLQRHSRIVESCLDMLHSITSHAHTLTAAAADDAGGTVVSCTIPLSLHTLYVSHHCLCEVFHSLITVCSQCNCQLFWDQRFCPKQVPLRFADASMPRRQRDTQCVGRHSHMRCAHFGECGLEY